MKAMKRMFLVLVVAVAAAAVGVGAAIALATGHDQNSKAAPVTVTSGANPQVLHYTSTTSKSGYVDNAPKGLSAGDQLTQHSMWSRNGAKAGTMALTATITLRTSPQTGEVMFTAVARLQAGQVALTGTFDIVPQNQTFSAAITGGTGAFRNARGEAVFKQVSGTRTLVTLYVGR